MWHRNSQKSKTLSALCLLSHGRGTMLQWLLKTEYGFMAHFGFYMAPSRPDLGSLWRHSEQLTPTALLWLDTKTNQPAFRWTRNISFATKAQMKILSVTAVYFCGRSQNNGDACAPGAEMWQELWRMWQQAWLIHSIVGLIKWAAHCRPNPSGCLLWDKRYFFTAYMYTCIQVSSY